MNACGIVQLDLSSTLIDEYVPVNVIVYILRRLSFESTEFDF